MRTKLSTCAVFCRVVDNYGDAGVALRLARQLALEHGLDVTLYIDDVERAKRIAPADCGVAICPLTDAASPSATLVIETFGCGIPDAYLDAMEARQPPPIWINLEYLSAESWVNDAHGLPSPPPRRALRRWFFFPGFTSRTGGVLRERDLVELREAHARGIASHAHVWHSIGIEALPVNALTVSLFCYPNRAAPALLSQWTEGDEPVVCVVPEGVLTDAVAAIIDKTPRVGEQARRGALTLVVAPLVDQIAFDARLGSCALNFVRGEDSFVRAQLVARPLVWHIYPQADNAHLPKLAAFLDLYSEHLASRPASALRDFTNAWNAQDATGVARTWRPFRSALPALSAHARGWSDATAAKRDLASGLVEFALERL